MNANHFLRETYGISNKIIKLVENKESDLNSLFGKLEKIREFNQYKVIAAMQNCRLSTNHFNYSTGYGYGDIGRDKVEEIYKMIFKSEDALVRTNIVSGTHAIYLAYSSVLNHGDEVIAISGLPYDTLQTAIGIVGNLETSLINKGVKYKQVDLVNGEFDMEAIKNSISNKTKMLTIQRSIGYSLRSAIPISKIKKCIEEIKSYNSELVIMVDNCYGEFTDIEEPIESGADLIAGSLIKNPGGGLAISGGYLAGRFDLIEKAADRLSAPGLGKELGISFGTTRNTLQGLYFAPHVVCEALKGAMLFSEVYESLGFNVVPSNKNDRSDIVQCIELGSEEAVVAFCEGIQQAAVVDSFVKPEPWDMPGYENKIVMASGSFIDGSSIEISADAPIRKPYVVFLQGGLTYDQCKLAVMITLKNLEKKDILKIN